MIAIPKGWLVTVLSGVRSALVAATGKTKSSLDGSHVRFDVMLDHIADGILVLDRSWIVTYVNAEAVRITGIPRADLIDKNFWELFPEALGTNIERQLRLAITEHVAVEFENHYEPWRRWFENRVFPNADGGLTLYFRDITDRKQNAEMIKEQNEVLEQIARGCPLAQVLAALCHMVEKHSVNGVIASVLILDEHQPRLIHGAGPSLPQAYIEAIDGIAVGPDVGSCGTAAYLRQPIHVADIATDQLWTNHAHLASAHGLAACWSQPILSSDGEVLGTFAMYYTTTRQPAADDLRLVDTFAQTAAIAIERDRTNQAVRRRTSQFVTLLNQAPLGVFVVDADFKVRDVNPTALPVFSTIPDLIDRDFSEVVRILWSDEYADYIIDRFRHTLETGEQFTRSEHIDRRRDSGVRECYEWQINRIPLPDGTHGVVCYFRNISAEVLAREAIAESEARFRMLAENVSQLFWACKPDGQCDLLSRQWVDYTGILEQDQLGLKWLDLVIHPDDRERTIRAWMNAVHDQASYDLEFRIKGADGIYRWFKTRGTPIRDDSGTIIRWFGTCTEIDAQVKTEQALRLARDRFQTVLQNAPIVLFTLDSALRTTWVLNSFEGSDSIIGKTDLEVAELGGVISIEDAMALTEFKKRVLESGIGERLEQTFTIVGELKTYDTTLEPIRDANGQVVGLAGVSLDISERKRAEEALRLETARTRRIIDSNIIGVLFANPDRILDANDAFLDMIGYTKEDLQAGLLNWREMTPAEHTALDNKVVEELNQVGVATPWQKEFFRKDGTRVPVMIGAAVFDNAPTWVAFVQDMSHVKEVENELRRTDRRKDEFLAMLAHELRNPLAAISNAVTIASHGGLAEHIDWSISVIKRQVTHLTRLIDDLLDVSRINQGKIELRKDLLEVTPLLESAVATADPLIRERKHTLDVSLDRGNLWVLADPTRLEQVVVNLLNNAAKYSENQGHIWLHARSDQDSVNITVGDRGIGIPKNQLNQMFELFVQGDRALARSEGGLGIGLTVVKRLVEMHGGTITARSEGAGKGSQFTIRLPVAQRPVAPKTGPQASAALALKKSRILIVDDNIDTARSMAKLLTLIGHDVATAYSGPEALEVARNHRPAFVLLDIGLPGMDGYEVASRLRHEDWRTHATVVAVSGYGKEEDRRRAKEAGFDHHLTKPLDHDLLLTLISGERTAEPTV